ncbi:hypothetical protein LCGC14_1884530 [marine sediment metagenome]|uniref:Uncharacterized protein n=1 Tax=marine sediment metagenome TaxID=412755 RepID=A0A0F9IF78_9ZZZZ
MKGTINLIEEKTFPSGDPYLRLQIGKAWYSCADSGLLELIITLDGKPVEFEFDVKGNYKNITSIVPTVLDEEETRVAVEEKKDAKAEATLKTEAQAAKLKDRALELDRWYLIHDHENRRSCLHAAVQLAVGSKEAAQVQVLSKEVLQVAKLFEKYITGEKE